MFVITPRLSSATYFVSHTLTNFSSSYQNNDAYATLPMIGAESDNI